MLSLKKHFSRSTQKIKRTIKGQKHTDETFDLLIQTIQAEQRAIIHFEKHVNQMMSDVQSQHRLYHSFSNDLHLMYSCGSTSSSSSTSTTTSSTSNEALLLTEEEETSGSTSSSSSSSSSHSRTSELGDRVEGIAQRMNDDVVQPFLQRAKVVLQKLEGYRIELHQCEKSEVIKRRNNRLLDFEIVERKYMAAQAKVPTTNTSTTNSTSSPSPNIPPPPTTTASTASSSSSAAADKELAELSNQYETIKLQFEELDRQAKEILRGTIMRRYTVMHDVLSEFFYEVMGQYHSAMGKLSQSFFEIHFSVQTPQPLNHEKPVKDEDSVSVSTKPIYSSHLMTPNELTGGTGTTAATSTRPESGSFDFDLGQQKMMRSSGRATTGEKTSSEYMNVPTITTTTTDTAVGKSEDLLDFGTVNMETLTVSKPPESRLSRAMELGGPTHEIVEAPYRPKSLRNDDDIVTTTTPDPWSQFPTSIDDITVDNTMVEKESNDTVNQQHEDSENNRRERGELERCENMMLFMSDSHDVVHDSIHDMRFDQREQPEFINQTWFYLDDEGERQGPVPFPVLRNLRQEGVVNDETLIFTDGMDKWVALKEQLNLPNYMV